MIFGFTCMTIHKGSVKIRYPVKSNHWHRCGQRKTMNRIIHNRWKSLNKIDVQQFLKLPQISMLRHWQVLAWYCSTVHHWYGLLEPKSLSCTVVHCMTQSFTPHLGLPRSALNCWWIWFPIVWGEWMCMSIETILWIMESTCQQSTVQAGVGCQGLGCT